MLKIGVNRIEKYNTTYLFLQHRLRIFMVRRITYVHIYIYIYLYKLLSFLFLYLNNHQVTCVIGYSINTLNHSELYTHIRFLIMHIWI